MRYDAGVNRKYFRSKDASVVTGLTKSYLFWSAVCFSIKRNVIVELMEMRMGNELYFFMN